MVVSVSTRRNRRTRDKRASLPKGKESEIGILGTVKNLSDVIVYATDIDTVLNAARGKDAKKEDFQCVFLSVCQKTERGAEVIT